VACIVVIGRAVLVLVIYCCEMAVGAMVMFVLLLIPTYIFIIYFVAIFH
jgi:hypothetical protein